MRSLKHFELPTGRKQSEISMTKPSNESSYDIIIVGAGAAGSLLAGRLASQTELKILLLEYGHRDTTPLIHMPAGFAKLLQYGRFLYPYLTVPQEQLNGEPRAFQQGWGLGGGSSINAMAYVRGQPRDYAQWQEAVGDTGRWSYDDLLPHFKTMEGSDVLSEPWHGADGPLKVSQLPLSPINQATVKAFQEIGVPYNADYNGAQQRGVGPCQLTIDDGRRCSSAVAFLHPAEARPNLTVSTGSLATEILLDGDRAIGVAYSKGGATYRALADQIIVSAGAINTPRLLMLSGIGSEAELARHGIKVKVRSEDVGQHLQDHPQVPVIARTRGEYGYAKYAYGLGMIAAGAQYLATRTGPAASNGIESVAYFNPEEPDGEPTIQSFHSAVIANEALGAPDRHPGLTLENVLLQPKSRGSVALRDADPHSDPLIDPNWLADPEDMRIMIAGVRFAREVLAAPALRNLIEYEVAPGPEATSDEALVQHAKRRLTCMWHPIGTCRMGADEGSVVDASLRVRGVRNLRVIDASIMPNIVSGNTNGPTMALASRGLEIFRAEAGV